MLFSLFFRSQDNYCRCITVQRLQVRDTVCDKVEWPITSGIADFILDCMRFGDYVSDSVGSKTQRAA